MFGCAIYCVGEHMFFSAKEGGKRIGYEVSHQNTRALLLGQMAEGIGAAYAIPAHFDREVATFIVQGENYFKRELRGSQNRMKEYVTALQKAKRVHILIGCCDARVGVPYKAVNQEMFIYLPYIGGGDPGTRALMNVMTQLQAYGVYGDKVDVITAQHGTTQEIHEAARGENTEQCDCVECGLRLFRRDNADRLDEIASSPSHLTKLEMAKDFSRELGGKLSPNLILIAASRNWSGNIIQNLTRVYETTKNHVSAQFYGGLFDHKRRELHVFEKEWESWEHKQTVQFPGEHTQKGQDPVAITISVGSATSTLHSAVFLPGLVGKIGMKNDFSTCAPSGTRDEIQDAISQASYAAVNYLDALTGQAHGGSFHNLQSCVFLCDTDRYVQEAQHVVESQWFKDYYHDKFLPLHAIYFVNTETKQVSSLRLSPKR
jgi:hypothetical protein